MISIILLWTVATASFTDCAPDTGLFKINELSSQPNSIVKTGHPVTFRIIFTVPHGLYIPSANVAVTTSVDRIVLPIRRSTYTNNPMVSKQYNYTSTFTMPIGVYGRIRAIANFYNESGTQLMCARWNAYASRPNARRRGWLTSLFA